MCETPASVMLWRVGHFRILATANYSPLLRRQTLCAEDSVIKDDDNDDKQTISFRIYWKSIQKFL